MESLQPVPRANFQFISEPLNGHLGFTQAIQAELHIHLAVSISLRPYPHRHNLVASRYLFCPSYVAASGAACSTSGLTQTPVSQCIQSLCISLCDFDHSAVDGFCLSLAPPFQSYSLFCSIFPLLRPICSLDSTTDHI